MQKKQQQTNKRKRINLEQKMKKNSRPQKTRNNGEKFMHAKWNFAESSFEDLANERFRLQESAGYNDRLQFRAFVCDKASTAPGGLNKFHNTLHFDPRWIIRASAYLFTRGHMCARIQRHEFIKLSRAPLCRSLCTACARYKYGLVPRRGFLLKKKQK